MRGELALTWRIPPSVLAKNVGTYAERMLSAVLDLATFFAARIESYAKTNAPWTDRTGHARQGLTARAFRDAKAIVLVLFHTVHYGIWLEVKNLGRYAIILKTLETHHGPYMQAIQRLLR